MNALLGPIVYTGPPSDRKQLDNSLEDELGTTRAVVHVHDSGAPTSPGWCMYIQSMSMLRLFSKKTGHDKPTAVTTVNSIESWNKISILRKPPECNYATNMAASYIYTW